MKKPIKKSWVVASALTIGMAVLTPLQAGASSIEPTNGVTIQIEQQITGTIKSISEDGVDLKGRDGKKYYISFYKFSKEQLIKMNLVEGQEITVEGSLVEHYLDFYTFEVYKKELPKEVSKDDLTKLEKMYNEMRKLEKEASKAMENKEPEVAEKKYQEAGKIFEEMRKITKPYFLANWQPQTFEEYLGDFKFGENNIVIAENDKIQLKAIYEEWVKLEKDGQEERANKKMEKFHEILQPYFDKLSPPLTFEEFMADFEFDIPAASLAKLKTLYEDAQKAEKDDNPELYDKLWKEFHYILDLFTMPQTFEEFIADADFEFKISKADSKQLKQIYEEILKLDKMEDQEKVGDKWKEFYDILEPYFKANKEVLISASKVTVNGQDYLPHK
ncbi:hypothetical protein LAV73_20745 [Lysinibacillus xylanilyticus]|uniref:hypothetical protein n=1 Tax=Lysinibacillus xylanilyticus TaxID=582475 RepID=UPI002B240FD6|nr:hypothetical protein [Lysinibacillus xylanilyticus]MEB2282383.1 hypothetical protein [Lysinibacillus xylanilyticus]